MDNNAWWAFGNYLNREILEGRESNDSAAALIVSSRLADFEAEYPPLPEGVKDINWKTAKPGYGMSFIIFDEYWHPPQLVTLKPKPYYRQNERH